MKLLLCVSSLTDIQETLDQFKVKPQADKIHAFLWHTLMLPHKVDILETGTGIFQTAFKLAKVLAIQRYHLALKVSFGNSYKERFPVGTILNIVNDKPGDYGKMVDEEWRDIYDLGLLGEEEAPQVRGGFINLSNAYMNVFLPYKKVVGLTVNHFSEKDKLPIRLEKYKADCETTDGVAFAYACLHDHQAFYHLCMIEQCLPTGGSDAKTARKIINNILPDLIRKL